MECPVPRTSRFAVSRLLRFSVNSRRQPVTARPVHHRCACRGSVRLSVAGAPVCLPGAGAPVCLWIINPLAGGRSPNALPESSVHFSSFDAPGNRFQAGNGRYAHRSSQSASGFYKRIKDHQAHADSLSASQLFSCTDDRKTHIHRRPSIDPPSNYRRFSIPESNKRMPADLHCQILPHESPMQAPSFGAFPKSSGNVQFFRAL